MVIEVINNITNILPVEIANALFCVSNKQEITEIRLRVGTNLRIYFGRNEKEINVKITNEHLLKILSNISSNSIYSVQKDINKGYITIAGGNRIGIAGEAVIVEGRIKNIKDISSMNIRVAHECIGVSNSIIDKITGDSRIKNTIIVSPPGLGKTTLLRDIVRSLSEKGYNITVIDERGEIAAMHSGIPSLNVGTRTDVISFVDKAYGMQMAVRSMAPQVICTDEIGGVEDIEAIKYICKSGVSYITTIHGNSLKDIKCGVMKEILESGYLDTVIILSNKNGIGSIDKIYTNLNCMEEVVC